MNYRELGTADRIRKAAPTGVDRILELALATNLELDLAVIKHGGTITTYSPERANPQLPVARLMREGTRLSFMLIYTTPPEALHAAVEEITSALLDRTLRPLPTTVFALEDIAAAHEASERGITGKVLIDTHRASAPDRARAAARRPPSLSGAPPNEQSETEQATTQPTR